MILSLQWGQPRSWSSAELRGISSGAKSMAKAGHAGEALRLIEELVTQKYQIEASDDELKIMLWQSKQQADSISLYQGLKRLGELDEGFMAALADRLELTIMQGPEGASKTVRPAL